VKDKANHERIKLYLEEINHRNSACGTVVLLFCGRNKSCLSASRYKGVAQVTSCKGFEIKYSSDYHWSKVLRFIED